MLKVVKETTYGTTPATPTMLETVLNSFTPTIDINPARSGQIRSHPFLDRLLAGPLGYTFDLDTELQVTNHDSILELLCGADFASSSVKMTDALKGATIESAHPDTTLFDSFTGFCVTGGDFTFPAQVGGIVTAKYSGMAKSGTLDAGATIATSLTAAALNDPFTFNQAAATVGGSAKAVTSLTISVKRTIDPLYLLGATQPDEYIPSDVTITGQIVIPHRAAAESTRLTAFTEGALVATCTSGANTLVFTLPKINYMKMGKPVSNRGVILQTIDWEAKYDTSSATVMTISKT